MTMTCSTCCPLSTETAGRTSAMSDSAFTTMDCQCLSGVIPLKSSLRLIDPKAWMLTGRPSFKYHRRQNTATKMEDEASPCQSRREGARMS